MGHGKRPFSFNESEEKEDIEEDIFPIYSARSQHDMSAMISVLSQVIGNTNITNNNTNISSSSVHGINPLTLAQPATDLQNQIQEQEPSLYHQQSSSSGGNFVSSNMSLELQQQQPSYYHNQEEDFLRFQMDFGNSSTSTGPPSESNWKDFEPRK
ncbi:hypothetical protein K7X08_013506 [Anisodus acutangulus]|uniref:Uncharacterized protein n=1 Tax=Anisodus acutangulus TaxID=402998 RepID=A0A9Q1LNV5_9SOLA|nr:hypothetical protein K7X08_013506 [Anisodus acutangulus]